MTRFKTQFLAFPALFAGVFLQDAAGSTITLGASAATLNNGVGLDVLTLAGPSFNFWSPAAQQGGVGYAYITDIPVGTSYYYSGAFSNDPAVNSSDRAQINGTITTPQTGTVSALFVGTVRAQLNGPAYIPADGNGMFSATLTGSFTACAIVPGYPGQCDAAFPYTFAIPINLPGQVEQPFDYNQAANTASFRPADASFSATPVPEPSSFTLGSLCAAAMVLLLRRRTANR